MRRYTVETPAGQIVAQLSDAEAKERGLKPTEKAAEAKPEKAAEPAKRSTATKRAEVAAKSFGAANKKPA